MVHPGTLGRKAAQAFVGARNTRGPYACLDRRQRPPSRSVRWGGERTECAAPTLSPHPSPAGLTRGSIIFVRTFCEDDGLRVKPGNDDVMPRVRRDPQPQSPHPPLAPLFPPKSLVLPREPAGGDAHDLLRVGDGGADHLRRAAVGFENRKRALGGGRVDHVAEA